MAETKKSKAGSEGVMDVAKPGKSAPPTTSKPIIVTNRPVLKDPMVVDEDSSEEKPENSESTVPLAAPSASKIKIAPISPDLLKGTVKADEEEKSAEDEEKPEETPETSRQTESTEPEPSTTEETEESDVSDDLDSPSDTKKKSADTDEVAEKKAAERQAELEKLAESRKYYLPINQVEKRRTKHYAIAGAVLIVLLGLVWADVALDAGLISIPGVKAPTHFFK